MSLHTNSLSVTFFWLLILATVCTAYAFIGAVEVMRYISPFTVILSYNLEPIYGILLSLAIWNEKEYMSPMFYLGPSTLHKKYSTDLNICTYVHSPLQRCSSLFIQTYANIYFDDFLLYFGHFNAILVRNKLYPIEVKF